jgi:hypothetical protein
LELEETHKFSSWNSSFAAPTAAAAGEGRVGVGGEGEMSFVFRGSRGDLETGLHNLMPDRRNSGGSSSSSNMVRDCFFLDYSSRNCLSLLFLFLHLLYFFVLQLEAILFLSFFCKFGTAHMFFHHTRKSFFFRFGNKHYFFP